MSVDMLIKYTDALYKIVVDAIVVLLLYEVSTSEQYLMSYCRGQ